MCAFTAGLRWRWVVDDLRMACSMSNRGGLVGQFCTLTVVNAGKAGCHANFILINSLRLLRCNTSSCALEDWLLEHTLS